MHTDNGPTAPFGASIVRASVALLAVLALAACEESGTDESGGSAATDQPAASDTGSTPSQ
jgi:hypothetical protein